MENLLEVNIPEEDKLEISQAFTTLETKFLPHLANLNADERIALPKMGDKTLAFVVKGISHMEQNPDFVPKFINIDEIKTDLATVEMFRKFYALLSKMTDLTDDTMLLAGSEAYVAVLAFYNYIKGAAKAKIPGAEQIYKDLQERFPRKGRKKE